MARISRKISVLLGVTVNEIERAFAGLGIDRDHTGAKDQPAGADGWRLMVPVVVPKIEPGRWGSYDIAHVPFTPA